VFRIKICGITKPEDALAAVEAGADAIGLNFYKKSARYIDPTKAKEIAQAISKTATPIGLFVNSTADEIKQICDIVGLHVIQLHGDEPPEFLGLINKDHDIIRARRVSGSVLDKVEKDLQACSDLSDFTPDAVLLDAESPGQYGGTGESLVWEKLVDWPERLGGTPMILAGGLTPENVAEAIRTVRPHGVDVASGVESSPGVKDREKMQKFTEQAKAAFAELNS
jgi:phosphoribosylanthranilate isomerase